jgi:hypothetical protein
MDATEGWGSGKPRFDSCPNKQLLYNHAWQHPIQLTYLLGGVTRSSNHEHQPTHLPVRATPSLSPIALYLAIVYCGAAQCDQSGDTLIPDLGTRT